jgi:mlo protein
MSGGATLEETPTWIVASVCSVIVFISIIFERALHYLGKVLRILFPSVTDADLVD